MTARALPYGAFNFLVDLGNGSSGGFSDVSGLTTETKIAEYRTGNEKTNYVHKVAGMFTTGDVTFKRGITDQDALQQWFWDSQTKAQLRDVTIKLVDPSGEVARTWAFAQAFPIKWVGPKLSAGSDSAAKVPRSGTRSSSRSMLRPRTWVS